MKQKLDLFKLLNQISSGRMDFIETLTEEEMKEFQPVVINMWLSNPSDAIAARNYYSNLILNEHIFSLPKHKKLLFKLMCISQNMGKTSYTFPKSTKKKTNTTSVGVVMDYYNVSKTTAELYLKSLNKKIVLDLASQLGYDKDILKKVENEYLET